MRGGHVWLAWLRSSEPFAKKNGESAACRGKCLRSFEHVLSVFVGRRVVQLGSGQPMVFASATRVVYEFVIASGEEISTIKFVFEFFATRLACERYLFWFFLHRLCDFF